MLAIRVPKDDPPTVKTGLSVTDPCQLYSTDCNLTGTCASTYHSRPQAKAGPTVHGARQSNFTDRTLTDRKAEHVGSVDNRRVNSLPFAFMISLSHVLGLSPCTTHAPGIQATRQHGCDFDECRVWSAWCIGQKVVHAWRRRRSHDLTEAFRPRSPSQHRKCAHRESDRSDEPGGRVGDKRTDGDRHASYLRDIKRAGETLSAHLSNSAFSIARYSSHSGI